MAMSLTFSNMTVHLHYRNNAKPQTPTTHLFQKATANHVLVYGMRKLAKPLHIRRIGVWASYNEPKKEEEPERQLLRTSSGDKAYYSEELEIMTLLKKRDPLAPDLAEELRNRFAEIPEERWNRLFEKILKLEHIPTIWAIAEQRCKGTSADTYSEAAMLLDKESKPLSPAIWSGKFNGATWLSPLTGNFKMAFFHGKDGHVYGRIISGKSIVRSVSNKVRPLYFNVKSPSKVPNIVKPCDLAFEFGDGQLQLSALPENFPKPAKHPRSFNGQLVYVRSAGPNVLVGQAMKLGKPCGELVLVKDCAAKK